MVSSACPRKTLHGGGGDSVAEEFRDEEVAQAVERVTAAACAGLGAFECLVEAVLGPRLALHGDGDGGPEALLRFGSSLESRSKRCRYRHHLMVAYFRVVS